MLSRSRCGGGAGLTASCRMASPRENTCTSAVGLAGVTLAAAFAAALFAAARLSKSSIRCWWSSRSSTEAARIAATLSSRARAAREDLCDVFDVRCRFAARLFESEEAPADANKKNI